MQHITSKIFLLYMLFQYSPCAPFIFVTCTMFACSLACSLSWSTIFSFAKLKLSKVETVQKLIKICKLFLICTFIIDFWCLFLSFSSFLSFSLFSLYFSFHAYSYLSIFFFPYFHLFLKLISIYFPLPIPTLFSIAIN